jgi:VCBS repeat-containing protein
MAAIDNAGQTGIWKHLNATPTDGTLLSNADGTVFVTAGGAPLPVLAWDHIGGSGGRPVTAVDMAAIDNAGQTGIWKHLNATPTDGTFLNTYSTGSVYVVAGGAPIIVTNWDNVGGGRPVTAVDIAAIENAGAGGLWNHLSYQPIDGTYLRGYTTGKFYRVSAGTPLLESTAPSTYVDVDQVALDNAGTGGYYNHLNAPAPVNTAPHAVDDTPTTAEDTPLNGNVLTNDTDSETTSLTAILGTGPTHGTLTLNANGTFTYTPTINYHGTDSFTYTASDGTLTDTSTATITITPVNDQPVAGSNSLTTAENTALSIAVNTLLANDSDVDGDTLSISSLSTPTHGTTSRSGDTITYTPTAGYHGPDTFTYTVSDGNGGTAAATVTISVTPADSGGGTGESSANSPQELAQEAVRASTNRSVGWIPVVGTIFNAMNLLSDFLDFTIAILEANTADIADEIGDMTIDLIGLVPIIGGALAAQLTPHTTPPGTIGDTANL